MKEEYLQLTEILVMRIKGNPMKVNQANMARRLGLFLTKDEI